MNIIDKRKSLEPCTESGWDAADLLLEAGLTEEDILSISRIGGSFLFLKNLKKPFFKVESHDYVIKGVLGDPFFRAAAYSGKMEELLRLLSSLSSEIPAHKDPGVRLFKKPQTIIIVGKEYEDEEKSHG